MKYQNTHTEIPVVQLRYSHGTVDNASDVSRCLRGFFVWLALAKVGIEEVHFAQTERLQLSDK